MYLTILYLHFLFLKDFFFMTEADSRFYDRSLIMDVPDDLNVMIKIDPDYMKRALDNLFNNALRHTDKDNQNHPSNGWFALGL